MFEKHKGDCYFGVPYNYTSLTIQFKMMPPITQIDAYQKETFAHPMRNGVVATHDVYTQGEGAKVLVLIQELPGIGQETLRLADLFVAEGYTVVLPHLFGAIGTTNAARNLYEVFCMRKEFRIFAKNESSPVVDYLSGLCTMLRERHQVKGVAVIGMCLTGNFAISLMANDAVLAGFASQPSTPFVPSKALHMSPEEVDAVKQKLDQVGPMHCGRFKGDWMCRSGRIKSLDQTFNRDQKERIIFHEIPGKGHAILTIDFVNKDSHPTKKAFKEIVQYFDEQLG
jgi:dienelactone hydrolase